MEKTEGMRAQTDKSFLRLDALRIAVRDGDHGASVRNQTPEETIRRAQVYLRFLTAQHVDDELRRIGIALQEGPDAKGYAELYAAQQALSWALDPAGFRSPFATIKGIQEAPADCSADPRPQLSEDIPDPRR